MSMFSIFVYLLIGFWIGFMIGLNYKQSPTPIMNFKRIEKDNKELEQKVEYYKKVIKDLVEDNRKLVKELDTK